MKLAVNIRVGLPNANPVGYHDAGLMDVGVKQVGLPRSAAPTRSGVRRHGLLFFAQQGNAVLQRPQADPQHFGGALAVPVHVI